MSSRNMIIIVVTAPNAPPCVVQCLKQVSLHVEVVTWCGKSGSLPSGGVFQVPDGHVCPACDAAIRAQTSPAPGQPGTAPAKPTSPAPAKR
jgi:hypothetical protein